MAKILIIEDENRVAQLLKRGLEESERTLRLRLSMFGFATEHC